MSGCWGPREDYYTFLGTELRFLATPIIISLSLGAITFGILYLLKYKEKINLPLYVIIIISIFVTILALRVLTPMAQVLY